MIRRCPWCTGADLYIKYHDEEWGLPVFDDKKQFEFLVLESAQAGLSWFTILRKRENYRILYDGFDPEKVVNYDETKIKELLSDPGIIRNRKKIEASISNAEKFLAIKKQKGSFSNYIWDFVDGEPIVNSWCSISEIPAQTDLSEKITKDLRGRGFKFLGPTVIYSHMQATGIVNDHIIDCFRYGELKGGLFTTSP